MRRRITRRPNVHRVSSAAAGWLFVLSAAMPSRLDAQTSAVNTYYVNEGLNQTFDIANGEFGPDVGGYIPFFAYGNTGTHPYASAWNSAAFTPPRSFLATMFLRMTDLRQLDLDIEAATGTTGILPFGSNAYIEGNGQPINAQTWWGRPFKMWPYRINGAPVLICVRTSSSGNVLPQDPAKILLKNYATHDSSFGSNKSHTATTSEHYQEFFEPDPEAGWGGPAGSPILGIEEQALEAGDIVVVTQETYSQSIWMALQRTQEANEFVRSQFIPSTLGVGVGQSFLYGGSWGGIESAIYALLQPKIYAASGGWTVNDMGYAVGDHARLANFQMGALAMFPPWSTSLDMRVAEIFEMIDVLGIRFDNPGGGWDVAALSSNRRPGDLGVKVYGLEANEDIGYNGFWSLADGSINSNFDGRLRRFMEHGAAWGVVPGKNEYAFHKGDEWATIVTNGAATTSVNPSLIPSGSAPSKVFPDPYAHTLHHAPHGASPNSAFLTPLDLGLVDLNVPGHPVQPSSIKTLGQGIWPGYRDSMRVVDVDGDLRPEVIFGTMDGFVHDLEFNNDANDPFRLDDQYKSLYLGYGVHSVAGAGVGGNTVGYFATSRGEVWKMVQNGSFSMGALPLVTADGVNSYDGEIPFVYVGDFDLQNPGNEVLILNQFLDWSLFDAWSGAAVTNAKLKRSIRVVGPGQAARCDLTGDNDFELLVPAADGHVWKLDPSTGFAAGNVPVPLISTHTSGGGPRALFRVDVANFGKNASPTNFLVFGKNDDLNDVTPTASTNVMMLYSNNAGVTAFVGEGYAAASDNFSTAMSFAWISPPHQGATTAEFVVAGTTTVQKYTMSTTGMFIPTAARTLVTFNPEFGNPNAITSVVTTPIDGTDMRVVVALGNGRIYVLDSNLQFLRTSDRESPGIANPAPWPSNRTLAHCMTTDLAQTPGADGDVYFADYGAPFRDVSGVSAYRLGRLQIPIGSNTPSWVPYVSDIKNPAVEDVFRGANRTLLYRDLDGDGTREPRVFMETGTAYWDPSASNNGAVREFCTGSYKADFNYVAFPYPYGARKVKGGNVFEYFDPPTAPKYNYLSGFNVPVDPNTPFQNFSGADWWYPRVGANRLSGQISCYSQSAVPIAYGTSMKMAMIRPDSGATSTVPHVVVGTNGGFVFAIQPGPQPPPTQMGPCNSTLAYASTCLGSYVIGMDTGNLDGDVDIDDEIVCGEWMDKGTFVDWQNNVVTKNRAHLRILDPVPVLGGSVAGFNVTDLTGDNVLGSGNGIGAGVTGVKIDDVDHNGVPEIWCTDAIGHLYLFRRSVGVWTLFYRSTDLGACPGLYNQIFVMKDSSHLTKRVVLLSSGYVMAFEVDPSLLAQP